MGNVVWPPPPLSRPKIFPEHSLKQHSAAFPSHHEWRWWPWNYHQSLDRVAPFCPSFFFFFLDLITHERKHPENLQGRREPAFCLIDGSACFMLIHCSLSWKSLLSSLYICKRGRCWDASRPNPASSPSISPARPHCHVLEKAQLGLRKPVLTQDYQVFVLFLVLPLHIYIYIIIFYSWFVKDTVKSGMNI